MHTRDSALSVSAGTCLFPLAARHLVFPSLPGTGDSQPTGCEKIGREMATLSPDTGPSLESTL